MPTKVKVANNAFGELASSITDNSTTITLATGNGARFPDISGDQYFYATLADTSNLLEIVKVTARSGDVFTVTRAQDGTTAKAYDAGDRIELRPVAALFDDLIAQGNQASGIVYDPSDTALTETTVQAGMEQLCTLPTSAKSANYTLTAADKGGLVSVSSGDITVPANVFDVGDPVVIYNNSSTNRTIERASGVTMYWVDGDNANRELLQRGLATIVCVGANEFVITGQGLL